MPGQGSPPPKPASFLATLLKRGAPAMATATSELSDEVSDPTPMRAIRRVSAMAAPVDPSSQDGLLLRAGRFVAVVPMAYRLISVPGALFVFLGAHGGTGAAPVIVVAVLSVALNLYGFRWLLRPVPFRNDRAAALLLLDGGFTVLANLAVAALVPPEVYVQATAVPGKHLLGAVALFTLALGLPYGLGLALGSIPLNLLMGWASTGEFTLSGAFAGLGTLLGVLLTGTGALVLVGLGTRLALAYGIRNGREAERARQHRMLHDTVLQTLEVMALPGSGPAEERVAELRRAARAASVELRQTIEASEEEASRPLGEKLASLAAEMARDGLRAQVVIAEMDEETLSEVRQIAVRDAVREAMRNTMKHSGTDKVLVRVEERDGGIAVITRDHGAGFSSDTRPPGFGISESITARLAEVGGKAKVESTPGSGTRVTLWVPC